MKAPMYPPRSPQVGEIVTLLNGDTRVIAQVRFARKAPRRWWYNVRMLILQGITHDLAGNRLEGMEAGAEFDSISTCWVWPEQPQFRCEGWRRFGGAFTLGPPRWEQCKETPAFILEMRVGKKTRRMPSCRRCLEELGQSEQAKDLIRVRPIA